MDIRWITRGAAAVLLAAVVVPGSLRAERPMVAPIAIADQGNEDALVKKAHAIHDRVITLDTHNDISPTELHGRAQLHAGPRTIRSTCRR